jgi:subtilisin family serine protease
MLRTSRYLLRRRQLAALLALPAIAVAVIPAGQARADAVRDSQVWVLDALNVQPAWAVTRGQGVTVAVIDSGVNPAVSDLVGSVVTGPDFSGVHTPEASPHWGVHGTWMASLIAGHGHGGGSSGIIGVAPQARILSIRVITDSGDPNFFAYEHQPAKRGQHELAEAIRYAVRHRAGVISMSLGYTVQSSVVRRALQDAYDHNVVVVASAGNSGEQAGTAATGESPYSFPADYPGVLAVGAVNRQGQPATFSSENLSVQVVAPGSQVPAQGREGGYWWVSGTSPACALTAGVAALIRASYPRLPDAAVISAIASTTSPGSRPAARYNDRLGFGEVNAAAALKAAGRLAAAAKTTAGRPPHGEPPGGHFGGGAAAIPPPPVHSRGRDQLVLFCLLGACSVAAVAVAISRMFALRDLAGRDTGPVAAVSAATAAGPPGRHSAPRGGGDAREGP